VAQNDMHVVVFKILAIVYDCMKRGVEPRLSDIDADAMGIPESYWTQIMAELVSHGFLTGVSVKKVTTGDVINVAKPRVTLDGVQYLSENKMMAKAAKILFEYGGTIASIVAPFL